MSCWGWVRERERIEDIDDVFAVAGLGDSEIKFGALMDRVIGTKKDYLATGGLHFNPRPGPSGFHN